MYKNIVNTVEELIFCELYLDNSLYLVGVNELICDAIDRTDGGSGVSNPELGLWFSDPVRRSLVLLV